MGRLEANIFGNCILFPLTQTQSNRQFEIWECHHCCNFRSISSSARYGLLQCNGLDLNWTYSFQSWTKNGLQSLYFMHYKREKYRDKQKKMTKTSAHSSCPFFTASWTSILSTRLPLFWINLFLNRDHMVCKPNLSCINIWGSEVECNQKHEKSLHGWSYLFERNYSCIPSS